MEVVLAGTDHMLAGYKDKEQLIASMARFAKNSDEAISVRIHTRDGRFEEERTYPHAADPPESKG